MSCDCNTLVVGESGPQGPQGLAGINGTNGTNGINAFTTTTNSFIQPAVSSSETVTVGTNQWMAIGQTVYIQQAGFYTVSSVAGTTQVVLNLLAEAGTSTGDSVNAGSKVSPSATATYAGPLSSLTVNGDSALDGSVTINDFGDDKDVRIEGDTDTNLFRTDASADYVGIGISAPETKLHVVGKTGDTIAFKVGTSSTAFDAVFSRAATFNNNQSSSGDFSVKGQSLNPTFFVDVSSNQVGIGLNNPSYRLDVNGTANFSGNTTVGGTLQVTGATTVAAVSASGAVSINGTLQRNSPATKTSNFSVSSTENWLIVNNSSGATTVTLPTASSWTGREIMIKTIQAQAVNSASSNVVPLIGGSAGTAILTGTAGKWATLVSDGSNWIIMAGG